MEMREAFDEALRLTNNSRIHCEVVIRGGGEDETIIDCRIYVWMPIEKCSLFMGNTWANCIAQLREYIDKTSIQELPMNNELGIE